MGIYVGSVSKPGTEAQKQAMANYFGVGKTANWAGKQQVPVKPKGGVSGLGDGSTYRPPARPTRPISNTKSVAPTRPTRPTQPSGKTVGSNKTGAITPIAPPKPPPLWTAEQDTVYQQQEAIAKKAFDDYMSGQTTAQNQFNIEDTRNDSNLQDQQRIAQTNMQDDFASRGMSESGLALKAYADQINDFKKQQSVMDQGALNFSTTAASQLGNFNATQAIDRQRYKNDAINRHATGLGLI